MASYTSLKAIKQQLGPLHFLDLSHYDIYSAHHMLGIHVKDQVHKILNHKLDTIDVDTLTQLLRQVHGCQIILKERSTSTKIRSQLQNAIRDYLNCLTAWSDGAGLEYFNHSLLHNLQIDGRSLSSIDLALLLQHDNSGCQTGLYRQPSSSVILWHTEEDQDSKYGSRFDQLRIAIMRGENERGPVNIYAFIYPDLMPGPAFGWRSDALAQAVDTLNIRSYPSKYNATLVNIVSWLTLFLGTQAKIEEILDTLRPFYDGYAINIINVLDGKIKARKYEYAADMILPYPLSEKEGSYLYQTNYFCQRNNPQCLALEEITQESQMFFELREYRTRQALLHGKDNGELHNQGILFFLNLISSPAGSEWAYANVDVKAYFLAQLNCDSMTIWLGPGPAMPREQPAMSYHALKGD
jgi:hypothetical protein